MPKIWDSLLIFAAIEASNFKFATPALHLEVQQLRA